MKKFVPIIAIILLLCGLFVLSRHAGEVARAASSPDTISARTTHSCVGGEVVTTSGTHCVAPGKYKHLTGIVQICNNTPYTFTYIGSRSIHLIPSGECRTFDPADTGTLYVNM